MPFSTDFLYLIQTLVCQTVFFNTSDTQSQLSLEFSLMLNRA
jgi:hypothetical protein